MTSSFFTEWRVELIPTSKLPTVVVFVVIIHLLVEKLSSRIGDVAAARLVTNPFGATEFGVFAFSRNVASPLSHDLGLPAWLRTPDDDADSNHDSPLMFCNSRMLPGQ